MKDPCLESIGSIGTGITSGLDKPKNNMTSQVNSSQGDQQDRTQNLVLI